MARPPFDPTPAQREAVATAAGGGFSHRQIAAALGCSPPTLRKAFAAELHAGAMARRMEVLAALWRAAKRGKAGAARQYLRHEPERLGEAGSS